MITLVFFARRHESLSADEFHEHWRERHGPLVRDTLGHHLVSYQQLHRWRPDGDAGDAEFDGVAVLQFAAMADFQAFLTDPAYTDRVAPDEDRFIDKARSKTIFTEGPVHFVGAGLLEG